jgi:3D (Asp-Asp-Asp) domain-containing protein
MNKSKIALLVSVSLLVACESPNSGSETKWHTFKKVTYYHRFEDRFGSKTASGIRAKQGVTVAAPRYIPLGTKITIPSIQKAPFTVQDRGRIVEEKDRIDVYIEARSRKEGRRKLRQLQSIEREIIL